MSKKIKNKELLVRTEIENTPFTVVTTENDLFITLGKYRITQPGKFTTKNEAIEYCKQSNNWEILSAFVGILVESYVNEINKNNKL